MKCSRTYWHKTLALFILGAFVYVQATALTCGIGRMFASQHYAPACHHKNEKHCCSDFTQAFFTAFSKSQTVHAEFSCKHPGGELAVVNVPFSREVFLHAEAVIVPGQPYPPPKIPDIRIFIRSFQV